jgi:hypothetical protein
MKTFRFQVALCAIALIVCSCPLPVWATIRTVTSTADSGAGTLRNIITASSSGDTINFSVTGTITLTSGELAIGGSLGSLNVVGPGATNLTVSGNNVSRVLEVLSGAAVNVSGLTIAKGYTNGTASNISVSGGGILNSGTLTLSNCVVSNNVAAGYYNGSVLGGNGSGGGIQNNGTLAMTGCTLNGNSAFGGELSGTGMGGGIYNAGTLALTNCTLNGNFAGGANASVNFGNGGSGMGGGIWSSGANVNVVNCTISGNQSDGGLSNASNGGGPASGGGVYVSSGSLVLENTIVAGNYVGPGYGAGGVFGTASGPDVNGTTSSYGFNLIGQTNNSTGWVSSDLVGSTATPLTSGLGSLQNNGGPTSTMALLTGSPAIDHGQTIPGLTTDQRGLPRPSGSGFDIGAYESQVAVVSIALNVPANITVAATGSSGATVFFTVSASGGCSVPTIVANPPSGSTFPVGTTTVSCTASDTCGNSTNKTFTVTVSGTDIGLHLFDGTSTNKIACGPAGTVTSKLRISKSGTTYGILLVAPSDPTASKVHIQTSTGVMALQKLP